MCRRRARSRRGRIELLIPSPGATAVRGGQCPSSVLADGQSRALLNRGLANHSQQGHIPLKSRVSRPKRPDAMGFRQTHRECPCHGSRAGATRNAASGLRGWSINIRPWRDPSHDTERMRRGYEHESISPKKPNHPVSRVSGTLSGRVQITRRTSQNSKDSNPYRPICDINDPPRRASPSRSIRGSERNSNAILTSC